MKLAEVIEMLAPFGVNETEARHLLSKDNGWDTIQGRVRETWKALEPYANEALSDIYFRIMGLTLKGTTKNPAQTEKEQREAADKFKEVDKKPNPLSGFGDVFGDIFGIGK